jgi:hypothetical protein
MRKLTKLSALLLGASILLAGWLQPAIAQEDDGKWRHQLTPLYLWAIGLEGDVGFGPVDAPLNIEFKDAIDDLEAVFTIHYGLSSRFTTRPPRRTGRFSLTIRM